MSESMKKLRITFIGHRGMGAALNLFPDQHWIEYVGEFCTAAERVALGGFVIPKGEGRSVTRFIPPAAIIEVIDWGEYKQAVK